jgi:hypothetical protein
MIAARYDAESIAKGLVERGVDTGAAEYFSDIGDYMRSAQKKAGVDPYAHPNGKCPQCGDAIMCDSHAARYCSRECRQRAYRVRKAAAEGRNSSIAKRARTRTIALAGGVYELHLKKPQRRKKDSAEPQGDTSPNAESETNVTPAEREAEEATP